MLEAFRNNAFDYLLKPIERAELKKVIDRYETNHPKQSIKSLVAELGNKIQIPGVYETWFLSPAQIFYLQGDGKYTDIFLTDDTCIKTSLHLKKLDEMLPEGFKRISKTNIVNTSYLQKLNRREKKCMLLVENRKVELSFSHRYFRE